MRCLSLMLLLVWCQVVGAQGYPSPAAIDFDRLAREFAWEEAYRALATKGVREHLEGLAKTEGHEHGELARALLYMLDGKSNREHLAARFKELQAQLKELGAAPEVTAALLERTPKLLAYAWAAVALYHHGDREALEFAVRATGAMPGGADQSGAAAAALIASQVAAAMRGFAWQRLPEDEVLKYLSSDDPTLRRGALVWLLGEAEAARPGAPDAYDPAKSAAANKKAIKAIAEHYRQELRPALLEEQKERLAGVAQDAAAAAARARAQTNRDALYTAYNAATGDEKKRLALELDRIEEVDYKKNFGHPYPGKPLDQALARRMLGIRLFISKMLHNMNYVKLLPPAEREKNWRLKSDSQQASLPAKLGMKDEAKTVAEGWAFLAHVDAVLDGREQELLHEELVWNYCGISFKYNHAAQAKTLDDYLKWENWSSFHVDKHDRFDVYPTEIGVLTTRWAAYMARNYKIEDYIRGHVMADIYRQRLENQTAHPQREVEQDPLYKKVRGLEITHDLLLPAELDEIEKVARLHLEETADFIAGKRADSVAFGMPPPKNVWPPKSPLDRANSALYACRAYVLWQAMVATTTFEDCAYLNELNRPKWRWDWDRNEMAKERYPALVAEFAATYQRLLENHPDLKPPAKK